MSEHICNAVIASVKIDTERGLSAWLMLDYGGSTQGFGGFLLYRPKGWGRADNPPENDPNFAGLFLYRTIEVLEAHSWEQLPGMSIRVKRDAYKLNASIVAIGHIIKDQWFYPKREFEELNNGRTDG